MNTDGWFEDLYLSGEEFVGKELVITIYKVTRDEVVMEGGKADKEGILFFEEAKAAAESRGDPKSEKRIVINRPSWRMLRQLFGKDSDAWIGKRIQLYTEFGKWYGKERNAIRIRRSLPA